MEEIKLSFPTPVDTIRFDKTTFFIKRDDLIHPDFSGNKARKLYHYLVNDFAQIKKLVSYGSNQSNAMYSMSVLAKINGWNFTYYTDHISTYLKQNPHGNFKEAVANGMNIVEGVTTNSNQESEDTLFINEGCRDKEAYLGIQMLASELIEQSKEFGFTNIFLPSGTGTTALFLQKSLLEQNASLRVYTTFCVGDKEYMLHQFSELEADKKNYPTLISPLKKYHFGKLYKELYIIWLKLQKDTDIEFDLLYDPIGWSVVMSNLDIFKDSSTLYIHQGGLLGNVSMKKRYERAYKDLV